MTSRGTPTPILLTLLVLTAGCLSAVEDIDDSIQRGLHGEVPLLLHADDPRKAPHPVSFVGAYERLHLEGGNHSLTVPGEATLRALTVARMSGQVAPAPNGSTSPPPGSSPPPETFHTLAPKLWIGEPSGRFVTGNGSVTNLTGSRTVEIITTESVTLKGITGVRTDAVTLTRGEAQVHGDPVPLQLVEPPEPPGNSTHPDPGSDGPTTTLVGSELTTGPDGLTVEHVRIPTGPLDEPSDHGTLHLEPGTYVWGGGPLVFPTDQQLPIPPDLTALTVNAPNASLTLHGEAHPADQVRLILEPGTAEGTVHPGTDRATFTVPAKQWWEHEQPRLEPRLHATVPGEGANATATVTPGANATLWLRVEETGRVGTAPEVNPRLDAPQALNATTGTLWYDEPNRTAFDRIFEAFRSFFGILVDLDEVTLDPGETRYLPLVVHAPHGTAPGTYDVTVTFQGDRTNEAPVQVQVTVTS